ncbi:DUF1772 domain-containing protein [Flavihumibacter solisilvae]|uniref:DUF1772 domain-containing protein n=1 Tax=Flavihumibacter solisilvae TaxID=1349421 RepID=A0A0C1INE3_9BACT|nr:DUF1772 domain-containing protein [Flavihumibacter solisilvae]KIC95765.1 hypothetical protein OI18_03720 [Flavihumibacter solisilvae]
MKKMVLYAIVAFSSGLFFTNIYNSIVNAANWESNIPQSITATRDFFVVANPGTFFKLIDPTNMLLIVLALILYWKKSSSIRLVLSIALLCYVSSMILTFTYFYPRNEVMFLSAQLPGTETLKEVASDWGRMNWVRSLLFLAGLTCSFLALDNATSSTQKLS